MLVALFIAAFLSLDTCADCSATGRDVKLCDPHAAEERSTLDREASGLKAKKSEAAIASLEAVAALTEQAHGLGANAVVGVDLDYETIGGSGSMLMVSASGTAVVLQ